MKDDEKRSKKQASGTFFREKKELAVKKIEELNEKHEDFLEKNDPIYHEPLTPQKVEVEGTAPLCRGSIDVWFFIYAFLLI